jgi:hypothetical protein
MAKRAKKEENVAVADSIMPQSMQPATLMPPVATANTPKTEVPLPGSMEEMMAAAASGGAGTVAAKATAAKTPKVGVTPIVKAAINRLCHATARAKSAESDQKAERKVIDPALTTIVRDKSRMDKAFVQTVNVDDDISFTHGRIELEKPSATTTATAIEKDLRDLLGSDYPNYITSGMTLSIKAAELKGYPATMATIALLKEKLGADFGRLFEFSGYLDQVEVAAAGTTVAKLTHDYVMDPVWETRLKPAIQKGLLKLQNVRVMTTKEAIATAGEKLAEEAEAIMAAKSKDAQIAALQAEVARLQAVPQMSPVG